jgi:hypothetical protein
MSVEDVDIYYFVGDYIFSIIEPNVTGNVEIFKYVLGKIILNEI